MNKLNLALTIAVMREDIESLKTDNLEVKEVIKSGMDADLNTRLAMAEMYEMFLISQPEMAEGSESMAKIYASLIEHGLRTIDQVPKILAQQVSIILQK